MKSITRLAAWRERRQASVEMMSMLLGLSDADYRELELGKDGDYWLTPADRLSLRIVFDELSARHILKAYTANERDLAILDKMDDAFERVSNKWNRY